MQIYITPITMIKYFFDVMATGRLGSSKEPGKKDRRVSSVAVPFVLDGALPLRKGVPAPPLGPPQGGRTPLVLEGLPSKAYRTMMLRAKKNAPGCIVLRRVEFEERAFPGFEGAAQRLLARLPEVDLVDSRPLREDLFIGLTTTPLPTTAICLLPAATCLLSCAPCAQLNKLCSCRPPRSPRKILCFKTPDRYP
jgi:hypothetical protein